MKKYAPHKSRAQDSNLLDDNTNTTSQKKRLLNALLFGPVSTEEARYDLDIMHPAGRIYELRLAGNQIVTHKVKYRTTNGKQRTEALYFLKKSVS